MISPPRVHTPPDATLWNAIEEHLDEAAYTLGVWEAALTSPLYTLDEVAEGPERCLKSHLFGLMLGGDPAFERLLEPALTEPHAQEPEMLTVATLVALALGQERLLGRGLWSSDTEVRRAIIRGTALGADARFDDWVEQVYRTADHPQTRIVSLELAAARRLDLGDLSASLRSSEPEEVLAAVHASAWCRAMRDDRSLLSCLFEGTPTLRAAALRTTMGWGMREAWRWCVAQGEHTADAATLPWLAWLGGPHEHQVIVQAMSVPGHRHHAVHALGLSGNPQMVDVLLPCLSSHQLEARLAGEAIAHITGLPLDDATLQLPEPSEDTSVTAAMPPLHEDDLDADLHPPVEEDLPRLDPRRVADWWASRRDDLDPRQRYLFGVPVTSGTPNR